MESGSNSWSAMQVPGERAPLWLLQLGIGLHRLAKQLAFDEYHQFKRDDNDELRS